MASRELDPDREATTPRISGTLASSPIWAGSARLMVEALRSFTGATTLARDACRSDARAVDELAARLLEADELAGELATIADVFDSWQAADPGSAARADHVARWYAAEDRGRALLSAPSASSSPPPDVEAVEPRRDRWPYE